jgi:hypothetical protein
VNNSLFTRFISVATVDYDYSKAYGGGGTDSVVSSVGGTLGDTTKLTTENMGSHRAALGANVVSDVKTSGVHEEVIVIVAPPGYVILDTVGTVQLTYSFVP